MIELTPKEAAIIAVYCNLKEKGKLKKENRNLVEKAREIINKYGLTEEQVKLIYDEFCNPHACKHTPNELELKRFIDAVFEFLNSTDYGYSEWRQHVEAYFMDRLFEWFKNMQLTEMNRLLNQLTDSYEEKRKTLDLELSDLIKEIIGKSGKRPDYFSRHWVNPSSNITAIGCEHCTKWDKNKNKCELGQERHIYICRGYLESTGEDCPYNCIAEFCKIYANEPTFCIIFSQDSVVRPKWEKL